MPKILAFDQGTTSSRAILFDSSGDVVAVAQREFEQHYPHPGWVEHDPLEIWSTQEQVAKEVLSTSGVATSDISAIGIANQRETTVVWERETGKPIQNAIVWQDRRTANVCDKLAADGCEQLIREKTGLVIDPYFSGTKIAWILDQAPKLRRRAEAGELAFGTVDSWLIFNMTAGSHHITDPSNASRTMLYNIRSRDWDDELLALLRVPREILPDVRQSSEAYCAVELPAPLAGVPIAGIAGDQQAALFGQTAFCRGQAKNTFGTGCFMLLNSGDSAVESKNRLLTTVAWEIDGCVEYALEGSVFVGGAVVQWLRDGLGFIEAAPEIESLAKTVDDNGGVFLVPAFAGLGAPHWDPYARGTMVGLTRGTTCGHIARAALESIAFQVADLAEAMKGDVGYEVSDLRVDGGAAANDSLMQMQADILQTSVVRPTITETTALGAAYLAGLATGVWRSRDAIAENWKIDRRFEPTISADRAAAERARWRNAVERSKRWIDAVD